MVKWEYRIDVMDIWNDYENEKIIFKELLAGIVKEFKESECYKEHEDELERLVDELKNVSDIDEFDDVWNDIYDWASWNRVWIATLI